MTKFYLTAVFLAGFINLSYEMLVSRLLAPFYGVTNVVWAAVISILLIAIALGSIIGGRLSESKKISYSCLPLFSSFLMLFICSPGYQLMKHLFYHSNNISVGSFVIVFLVSLLLLALPPIGVAAIFPITAKLIGKENLNGNTVGYVYAVNTIGSVLGAVITVLFILPLWGLQITLYILSGILLLLGFAWKFISGEKRPEKIPLIITLIIWILLVFLDQYLQKINHPANLVYQKESSFNSIEVVENDDAVYVFQNDPHFVQSIRYKKEVVSKDVWHSYLLGGFLTGRKTDKSVLLIGFGAGTTANYYRKYFPDYQLSGIEIDPEMVNAGRKYILKDTNNIRIYIDDGRSALYKMNDMFDIIICDAFRFPYLPQHLASLEFISLLKERNNPGGVVVINAGRYGPDDYLVQVIGASLCRFYKKIYRYDIGRFNSILFATDREEKPDVNLLPLAIRFFGKDFLNHSKTMEKNSKIYPLSDGNYQTELWTHIAGIKYLLNGN